MRQWYLQTLLREMCAPLPSLDILLVGAGRPHSRQRVVPLQQLPLLGTFESRAQGHHEGLLQSRLERCAPLSMLSSWKRGPTGPPARMAKTP